METRQYEIRLSGSGGQGIILAAVILAEAAGVYGGKYVCQTQSYGPEVRGGTSKAEVIISDHPIDYPKAIKPDLLLAMNQASCDTYFNDLKPEGLLVVDADLVRQVPVERFVAIPFTKIAQKTTNSSLSANVVALGALGYFSQMVTAKDLESALAVRLPQGVLKMNRKALRAGIQAAGEVDLSGLPAFMVPDEEEV